MSHALDADTPGWCLGPKRPCCVSVRVWILAFVHSVALDPRFCSQRCTGSVQSDARHPLLLATRFPDPQSRPSDLGTEVDQHTQHLLCYHRLGTPQVGGGGVGESPQLSVGWRREERVSRQPGRPIEAAGAHRGGAGRARRRRRACAGQGAPGGAGLQQLLVAVWVWVWRGMFSPLQHACSC